jgi:general secretion pathway protein K
MKRYRRQAGAALLVAMLTVTLVASFAAAALWQQWRSVEVETADRSRVQAGWILTGALDWARLILREDFNSDRTDYLSEPWAVPLKEARLSTFLAADQNNTMDAAASDADDVFLSGEITDQQAKLNVACLVQAGSINQNWMLTFGRLFDVLGLPQTELAKMAENLRFAADISVDNRNASLAPLMPQRIEQLAWVGVPKDVIVALTPYVTVLPSASTRVNLNTAPAEVIYAVGRDLSLADAKTLVAAREQQHFRAITDPVKIVQAARFDATSASVDTNFFEVRGRLRMEGDVVVEERSLVQRNGRSVLTLQRERTAFQGMPATANATPP